MKPILLLSLAVALVATPALAQFCPHEGFGKCSISKSSCDTDKLDETSEKDYVEVSDSEIALLGKESFHANIAMIEKALRERGVKLPEKGFITSEFRSALISFQESVGLPANGEVNQATLDKLDVRF